MKNVGNVLVFENNTVGGLDQVINIRNNLSNMQPFRAVVCQFDVPEKRQSMYNY